VDLGGEFKIDQIVVWNRTDDATGRLANARVSVLDTDSTATWATAISANLGVSETLTTPAGGPDGLDVLYGIGQLQFADVTIPTSVYFANTTIAQPTGISLSSSTIAENVPLGTTVGTLSTTHGDPAATFTYTLVSGDGSTDNASFPIQGSALKTAATIDFETKTSYSVRVRTTDSLGLFIERTFTITATNVNEQPTAITLSGTTLPENSAIGTTIGTFSTTDVDAGEIFTYSLVSGTGSGDNAAFTIDGNALKTAATFNFEAKSSYSIRVRSTDAGGLFSEQTYTITVTDVNEAPTLVALSNTVTTLVENTSTVSRIRVADIAVTDDALGTVILSLTGPDAARFEIESNRLYLKAGTTLDYETQNSYSVTVNAADPALSGSPPVTAVYGLTLTNVYEIPQVVLSNQLTTLPENAATMPRIKVADITVVGDVVPRMAPGAFVQPAGVPVASMPTAYFDVTTSSLQLDPAGYDLSLFNFTFNTSVANVTNSTPGPFNYYWGTGASTPTSAAVLPAGTWSLTTTSPARLAGAVTLTNTPTLSTSGGNTASTSGWLNRPWSFGSLAIPGSISLADAQQNFVALGATSDTGFGVGRGQFQYTVSGRVGTFYGQVVVVQSSPVTTLVPTGANADLFEIDGSSLYLKAGTALDHETVPTIPVTVSIPGNGSANYTLEITNANEVPTNIGLSPAVVTENRPSGTTVGTLSTTDQDVGDTFTYSFATGTGDSDNASFVIVGSTLNTAATFDYEAKNTYSVRVRSTDAGVLSTEKVLTVTILNENDGPTALALSNAAILENAPAGTPVGTLTTTDQDAGDSFTYTLVSGTGSADNAQFQITGNSLKTNAVFDYETKNTYTIRVRTTDAAGAFTEQSFTITVTDDGEQIAPATHVIPENTSVGSVIASLSRRDVYANLTPLTLVYVASSGQMVFLNTSSSELSIQSVQIVSPAQKLSGSTGVLPTASFTLSNASDAGLYGTGSELFFGNIGTAALTLAVGGTWDLGAVAQPGLTSVQLVSSFATDPDVDFLPGSRDGQFLYQLVGGDVVRGLISYGYRTYTYSLVPGIGDTDNALFSIAGTSLKVAGGIDYEAKSRYTIRVRSTAQDGTWIEEVLSVNATDVNEAPTVVSLGNVTSGLDENTATSSRIKLADVTVTDDALGTNTLSLSGADASSFEIVGTSLYLKAGVTLDYETKGSYAVTVQASDSSLPGSTPASTSYTLTVANVNEAPTSLGASATTVAENQPVGTTIGTLTTTDPDSGDTFTYALVSGAGDTDNGSFEIVGNALKAKASFNYEAKSSYTVRIRTTDVRGLFTEQQLTVTVTDVNESPTAVNLTNATATLPESTSTASRIKLADIVVTDDALGTNILSLSGADASSFEIVGTALYLKSGVGLDFETKLSYAVTVSVADSGLVGPASVHTNYTLGVTNVNEAPTNVALSASAVAENQAAGASVGTLSTTDQDAGDTFTYTLVSGTGATDNGSFEIVGDTLKTAAAFDYETKGSYTIRVRTPDAGGLFTEKQLTVTVTDVNDAPTDIVISASSIAENQPAGTTIGSLSTTDQDSGDTFTYTLASGAGDTDNGSFEIAGGVLKSKASFDYEAKSSYTVRIRTTDAGGLFTEKQVTVTVTDVNEAPTALGLLNVPASVLESTSTASRVKVADIAVTDDALGTNTLSLSGADAGFFELVGTALYLKAGTSLDYGLKSSYAVTVSAQDMSLALAAVSSAATVRLANVPEFSGREYAEVPSGQTVVDTTPRTGTRQVIVRGGGTLVLAGSSTNTGGVKVEDGKLIVQHASALGTGTLDVRAGGTVALNIGFSKATVGGLSLASGAKVDLGTGGLTIAAGGTTLDALRSSILLARNGGAWNGTSGIGSANVDLTKSKVVGYRQLVSGAFQVAWASFGDTNLDGRINSTDVQAINTARKFGLPTRDGHWSQGDFSYDGRVNSTDILQLSPQFGKPSYYATTASSGTIDAPVASITAQLFAALGWVDPDGDGKL
jgi:autotransporter-associated beta strand protein